MVQPLLTCASKRKVILQPTKNNSTKKHQFTTSKNQSSAGKIKLVPGTVNYLPKNGI